MVYLIWGWYCLCRWMCGKSLQDKIINENRCGMVGITPIEDKMRENRLRWHFYCRSVDAVVRRNDVVTVDGRTKRRD